MTHPFYVIIRHSLILLFATCLSAIADIPLNLKLPTENDFLFKNQPEKFYMYVDRSFEGVDSKPWQAGSYGYVRNLTRTEEGVIATKFHEGLDIKPLKRDRNNKPLDLVSAIASGTVVYTNTSAGGSNYGKYIVIQHDWGSGPFFSLYAHLSTVSVEVGQRILAGTTIGQLGYTGSGLSRTRAHLHLELCMLLSLDFNSWHKKHLGGDSKHGHFHGMNLCGLDLGRLYLSLQKNRALTLPEFIRKTPTYFKVTLPRKKAKPFLLEAYPWLSAVDPRKPSTSWEISFTSTGLPTSITPSNRRVSQPIVTYVKSSISPHKLKARKLINGTGQTAFLTRTGTRYLRLLIPSSFPELN